MGQRGAKPKSAHLHLVEGTTNVTRHGSTGEIKEKIEKASKAFGKPVMPKSFKGEARVAWQTFIGPAWWLDMSKHGLSVAFCELWQEFRESPKGFTAARHGQLRAYMSELGLTDERNRVTAKDGVARDEFFDD